MRAKLFRGLLLSLLLFLGSGCTLSPQPGRQSVAYYRERADLLLAERHYSQAVAVLEEGSQVHPGEIDFLIRIGRIYLAQQRWPAAIDAFNRALAVDGRQAAALAGLAETFFWQGQLYQALPLWQQAATLDPELPEVFTGLGRTQLHLFDFEAALNTFKDQQRHRRSFEADWYLAALLAPSDLVTAREHLLAIQAANEPAQPVTESLLVRRDYLLTALVPFTVESPPLEVARATGLAMVQAQQWPLAVYALEAAQTLATSPAVSNETRAEILAFLAHARAQAGKPALDLFEQARQLDPTSALPLYFEGLYLRRHGALQVAEDRFKAAIELDAENAAFYAEIGRLKDQQGDLAVAERWYKAAVELAEAPEEFRLLLLKFYANRTYLLTEAGIPLAEQMIEAGQAGAEVYDLLGWMSFLAGEADGGLSALQQALDLDPQLVSARYHLGRYYEANGQPALARVEYQRVIDWDTGGFLRDQAYSGLKRLAGSLN